MKLAVIMLVAALAASGTGALAQTANGASGASSAASTGSSIGSSMNGVTTGLGDMSNLAGSAAAGANSYADPSGNSYINTSPSGSTLLPMPNAPSIGFIRR